MHNNHLTSALGRHPISKRLEALALAQYRYQRRRHGSEDRGKLDLVGLMMYVL